MNNSDEPKRGGPPPPPPPSRRKSQEPIDINNNTSTSLFQPFREDSSPTPPPPQRDNGPKPPPPSSLPNSLSSDQKGYNYGEPAPPTVVDSVDQQAKKIEEVVTRLLEKYIPRFPAADSKLALAQSEAGSELEGLRLALAEAQQRQRKISEDARELHSKQLEILRSAIAEERRESAEAQQLFEKTLQTKYENMVLALQDRVKSEQEARMRRALEDVERSARIESERSRMAFETQQASEVAISVKFKGIVGDLRKSWEEEEAARARQLEEKLRNHYSAILEHMEAQLQMALRLQDEADREWMDDVEARNRQQVEVMQAFEGKCRRLYETRLIEYTAKTEDQMAGYEQQLLEAGSQLASEKARFESRLRRLRLACSRWKADYQADIHSRYQELSTVMENKYMGEVERLLESLADAHSRLTRSQGNMLAKEKELLELKKQLESGEGGVSATARQMSGQPSMSSRLESLLKLWQGLGTPAEERVQILAALLDSAQPTPELTRRYEAVQTKLTARLPIMQMMARKQLLEHKIQQTSSAPGGFGLDNSARSAAMSELVDLQVNLDTAVKAYERQFSEKFSRASTTAASSSNSGGGNSASVGVSAVGQGLSSAGTGGSGQPQRVF